MAGGGGSFPETAGDPQRQTGRQKLVGPFMGGDQGSAIVRSPTSESARSRARSSSSMSPPGSDPPSAWAPSWL